VPWIEFYLWLDWVEWFISITPRAFDRLPNSSQGKVQVDQQRVRKKEKVQESQRNL
jgi:hypothetical protein